VKRDDGADGATPRPGSFADLAARGLLYDDPAQRTRYAAPTEDEAKRRESTRRKIAEMTPDQWRELFDGTPDTVLDSVVWCAPALRGMRLPRPRAHRSSSRPCPTPASPASGSADPAPSGDGVEPDLFDYDFPCPACGAFALRYVPPVPERIVCRNCGACGLDVPLDGEELVVDDHGRLVIREEVRDA